VEGRKTESSKAVSLEGPELSEEDIEPARRDDWNQSMALVLELVMGAEELQVCIMGDTYISHRTQKPWKNQPVSLCND
jgi:hypothetical protein